MGIEAGANLVGRFVRNKSWAECEAVRCVLRRAITVDLQDIVLETSGDQPSRGVGQRTKRGAGAMWLVAGQGTRQRDAAGYMIALQSRPRSDDAPRINEGKATCSYSSLPTVGSGGCVPYVMFRVTGIRHGSKPWDDPNISAWRKIDGEGAAAGLIGSPFVQGVRSETMDQCGSLSAAIYQDKSASSPTRSKPPPLAHRRTTPSPVARHLSSEHGKR